MGQKIKFFMILLGISVLPTLLIWIPFVLRLENFWTIPLPPNGMASVVANFDGPIYIALAKTFYNVEAIAQTYSFPLPHEYYAAHFPLYPFLIRLFSTVTNYPYSMLFVSVAASFLAIYFFHKLISDHVNKNEALWFTLVFAVFPARWLIVRSVGSPEPLFLASIISSVYYFSKKNYFAAGIWGAVAQFTKPPGILLFIAYILAISFPIFKKLALTSFSNLSHHIMFKKRLPLLLIPIALTLIFIFYSQKFGSFFAYFKSGDNIHLFFPPFQIFNYSQPWVNTFWLEDIIFIYLLGVLGIFKLIEKKEYDIAWFVGVFFFTLIFISHRDLLRYALPIIPFLFVAFSETISSKYFKIAMAVIVIPIFLNCIAFISQNVMPISDWGPLL